MARHLCGVFLILTTTLVQANNFKECSQLFYGGAAPIVTHPALSQSNYQYCFNGFAVNYSGISKTGLWSAGIITPETLRLGKGIKRVDNFYEDQRIPTAHRSRLSDFSKSGFDRGHLFAAADASSVQGKAQTFNLINIVPQNNVSNSDSWRLVEESLRAYVGSHNQPAYVITGPLFLGRKIKYIGNNLLVPTHVYKVVMFPRIGVIGAWVGVNDESGRIDVVSVSQLQQHSGISFFPTLADGRMLNYRYALPLMPNNVATMRQIGLMKEQTSTIFNEYPSAAYNRSLRRRSSNEDYQNNRDEAKAIGEGALNDTVGAGLGVLRKVLR